jgi:sugar phosphate permease
MMGNMVDMYGPRYGYSFLLLLTAPAIYCMALVTGEYQSTAVLQACCTVAAWYDCIDGPLALLPACADAAA